ncbi:MAG: DUF4097 family beta strand repeat-containing protein [Aerococcaceae bacterium]|nr:DUF4097 family beta strand repeat-containing protein [Aerococcaceae bacterium]
MNEKERIIELVRQNVMTMDEALRLLEAAGMNETLEEAATTDEPELVEENTNENVKIQLDDLLHAQKQKQEALTIAKQRLRELAIFAELDELTDEMRTQQAHLETRMAELEQELADVEADIALAKQQQSAANKAQAEHYKEEFKQAASQFSEQAVQGGRKLGSMIKNFVENIDFKDISTKVKSWTHAQKMTHTFVFDNPEVAIIDMNWVNGDLTVRAHDEAALKLACEFEFRGIEETVTAERLAEYVTAQVYEQTFQFKAGIGTVATMTLYVPQRLFEKVQFTTVSGDVTLSTLQAKELHITNKTGDLEMQQVTADLLTLEILSGDVELNNNHCENIVAKLVNGDVRMTGAVANVTLDSMNSDVYITKQDTTNANLRIKLATGDIKIALPEKTNLRAECHAGFGEVRQRLAYLQASPETIGKHMTVERHTDANAGLITLHAQSKTGDIYLKDSY